MKSILIEANHNIGEQTAKKAGIEYCKSIFGPFPDNETYFRAPCSVKGKNAFLLVDFAKDPNNTLAITILASSVLDKMGAKKIYLIAPYAPYLRQDHAFHEGEAVSGKIISNLLSKLFDGIITIDPHLHRIHSMKGFYSCKTQKLTATETIAEYANAKSKDFVFVGPDAESKQWIQKVARYNKNDFVVAKKTRYGSRKVEVEIIKKGVKLEGRKAIIVDDIISTGHTVIEAAKGLKKEKVKSIDCYCVHGLFMEKALEKLKQEGITPYATNTTKNEAGRIDITGILAEAIKKWE
jgi:ribose-phosphate pyrophosphokinase